MRQTEKSDLQTLKRRNERRFRVAEAARCLDVHERTVRRMCGRGELDGVKVGGRWRIDRDSLRDALQNGTEDLL